jgi:cytochrome c biogenesis protein
MGGGTLSAAGSFKGSVTVPQGLNFVVGDVLGPTGFLSIPTDAFNTEIHVNRFSMDYFESGEVNVYLFFLYEIGVMILATKFMKFQPE